MAAGAACDGASCESCGGISALDAYEVNVNTLRVGVLEREPERELERELERERDLEFATAYTRTDAIAKR